MISTLGNYNWINFPRSNYALRCSRESLFGADDLDSGLDVGELLLLSPTGRAIGGAEDELCPQVPVSGDVPLGGDALRDALLVMLQAAAEAFGAKGGPSCGSISGESWTGSTSSLTHELGDTVAVVAPFGEILDQVTQKGWHAIHSLGVIVEKYLLQFSPVGRNRAGEMMGSHRAIRFLEEFDVGAEFFEQCRRIVLFGVFVGKVPQLLVIMTEKDDGAGGLDVERTGGVENGVLDELDDAGVGDGRFLLDGDGGATMDGCFEEVVFASEADGVGLVFHAERRCDVIE